MGRVDLIGGGVAQAIFTLTIAVSPYGTEIRLIRAGPNNPSALQSGAPGGIPWLRHFFVVSF